MIVCGITRCFRSYVLADFSLVRRLMSANHTMMHTDCMIRISASTPWYKVLKYQLTFFRRHQEDTSYKTWANLDTDLYVTSGLITTTATTGNTRFEDHHNSKSIPCLRFNKPTPHNQFPCDEQNGKYGHFCNLDTSRCKGSHPAFTLPLPTTNLNEQYQPERV